VEDGENPDKPLPNLNNILNEMNKVKIKINDKKKEDEFDMELEMNIEK
jgi:hypothetical protein